MPKVIDTVYKGFKFRSRLEARWAVFLDAAGVRWEYEPEGYEFSNGMRYLPDFKLFDLWNSDSYCWFEVKPNEPKDEEFEKLWRLCSETDHFGFIAQGYPAPCDPSAHLYGCVKISEDGGHTFQWSMSPFLKAWAAHSSGKMAIVDYVTPGGGYKVLAQYVPDNYGIDRIRMMEHDVDFDTPSLRKAYEKARMARFEFGKSGN